MKRVTKIQTSDGALHDDVKAAQRHAEARYADVLNPLAHRLAQIDKYSAMCEALDRSLPEFRQLLDLKADMQMEDLEED